MHGFMQRSVHVNHRMTKLVSLVFSSSQPSQPFRPPSGGSDPGYSARFPGQQPQFRPGVPGEGFSSSHPFPSHGPGMGPRMPGQEGFSSFPSPQHPGVRPSTRDGSYSGSGRCRVGCGDACSFVV